MARKDMRNPDLRMCGNCYNLHGGIVTRVLDEKWSIVNYPAVLLIQLARFDPVTRLKTRDPVELHLTLNFTRSNGPKTYNLRAVIVHRGPNMNLGHYYTYIRTGEHRWVCKDDQTVYPITEQRVLTEDQAYILVYSDGTTTPPTNLIDPMLLSPPGDNVDAMPHDPESEDTLSSDNERGDITVSPSMSQFKLVCDATARPYRIGIRLRRPSDRHRQWWNPRRNGSRD